MAAHRISAPRRPYRLGRRMATVETTRERIVAAAFHLHATVGPSRTTISAIAERACVQRHTVYSHFPDIDSLYVACTTHGMAAMGMPTAVGPWSGIDEPVPRLRAGLTALTAWYRTNAVVLQTLLSDVDPTMPPPLSPDPYTARMTELRAGIARGWRVRRERQQRFGAILDHVIAFETWRSLSEGGLTDSAIVDLLVAIVRGVADGSLGDQGPTVGSSL